MLRLKDLKLKVSLRQTDFISKTERKRKCAKEVAEAGEKEAAESTAALHASEAVDHLHSLIFL